MNILKDHHQSLAEIYEIAANVVEVGAILGAANVRHHEERRRNSSGEDARAEIPCDRGLEFCVAHVTCISRASRNSSIYRLTGEKRVFGEMCHITFQLRLPSRSKTASILP